MVMTATAKAICGSATKDSHAKSTQPGKHEWITIITAINAAATLPPQFIFLEKTSITMVPTTQLLLKNVRLV